MNIIISLFFILYIILPEYFAVEISSDIPLFTGNRILLLLLICSYVLLKKGRIKINVFKEKKKKNILFGLYFLLVIISNLYYCFITSSAIKRIFSIILEELLLVWIVCQVLDNREKFIYCLKMIVYSSGIVALISIISVCIENNLFYYLNTVSREMLMANYSRLGLIRAEAGFGHPVYYGAYIVCVIPIILYFINSSNRKNYIYIISLILNLIALILSNSRGSLFAFLILSIYIVSRENIKFLIKKYGFLIICAILILIMICLFNEKIFDFVSSILLSIVNVFNNEIKIDNYGTNTMGLKSRTLQFSQVIYAAKENFLFGLGDDAQNRGVLKWYTPWTKGWNIINTFDVGYFAIFCQYGMIGTLGYIVLYILLFNMLKNDKNDKIMRMLKYMIIGYLIILLSVSQLAKVFWIIVSLIISYKNILCQEGENK